MSRKSKEIPVEPRKAVQLRLGSGKKKNFRTTKWPAVSPSSEFTRSESFWHVRTNVTIELMWKFLRLRTFWGQTSHLEREFVFSSPMFLNDVEFNVLLALLATTKFSHEEIIERMSNALDLIGKTSSFREDLLPTWDGHIFIIADLETRSIRPHKAYSGWVRNASSVGSKRKQSSHPDPTSESYAGDKFDEYTFLYELTSVGSIETDSGIIRLS